MRWRSVGMPLRVLRQALYAFVQHDVLTLSAALAFYTLLSFAPLMVMMLWATGTMGQATQAALLRELSIFAGEDARLLAKAVLDSVRHRQHAGAIAGAIGTCVILVGATSVFAQLQATLNAIWDIPPRKTSAIRGWLRRRIISAGVLLAIGFVLIASTLISAALGIVLSNSGPVWDIVNQIIATVVLAGLFAVLFRYVPDSRLPWKHALEGGLTSAVLFGVGKWVIGAYLARGDVGGAYGAAGSMVVLLVWTYYSAAVFFFSAELLQAWVDEQGEKVAPHARSGSSPQAPPRVTGLPPPKE